MLAAVALHRSYIAGRPTVDTIDQPSTCVAPYKRTQPGLRRRSASRPTPSKPMKPTWERSRVRSQLATITTIRDGGAIPLR